MEEEKDHNPAQDVVLHSEEDLIQKKSENQDIQQPGSSSKVGEVLFQGISMVTSTTFKQDSKQNHQEFPNDISYESSKKLTSSTHNKMEEEIILPS